MAWWKRPRDLEGSRSPTPGPIWDYEEEETSEDDEDDEEEDELTPRMTGRKRSRRSISPVGEDNATVEEDSVRELKRARALGEEDEGKVPQESNFSNYSQRIMVCT